MLPRQVQRSLEELQESLDLSAGDVEAKRSAFWTMLVLSAVIATAGVLADSTATVIGAMIVAPLSVPIMGLAVEALTQNRPRSLAYVASGAVVVGLVGLSLSWMFPHHAELLDNSQISGRTSPTLSDLLAALATGFAGAVAWARKDLPDVLPGVAIAVSLVPPLAVAGVCLGRGAPELAFGAVVLFLSNLLALVLAGIVTFAALGYSTMDARLRGSRRPLAATAVLLGIVSVPLASNTLLTAYVTTWRSEVRDAAQTWADAHPGTRVVSVEMRGATAYVEVVSTTTSPPVGELRRSLEGRVPGNVGLVVDVTVGRQVDAGVVGGE